ncbi:MAG: signal peptidase I [Lachnospiraceae bacterium]|nr:signal peptidase I [Lachnospiraceae bacterium]
MNHVVKEILNTVIYLAVALLLTFLIVTFVGQRTRVDGQSMEPTLFHEDNLIVDKLTYRFHDPERFDIIVFPIRWQAHTYYIKRIIGLPGETVQIDEDGKIYIDGELLEEDYGKEQIQDPGRALAPVTLGEDEYFVLGDNRNHSSDSRTVEVGSIKRADIIGRAWVRIYPFDRAGVLKHD